MTLNEHIIHKDRYSALLLCNFIASRFAQLTVDKQEAIRTAYNDPNIFGGWVEHF